MKALKQIIFIIRISTLMMFIQRVQFVRLLIGFINFFLNKFFFVGFF